MSEQYKIGYRRCLWELEGRLLDPNDAPELAFWELLEVGMQLGYESKDIRYKHSRWEVERLDENPNNITLKCVGFFDDQPQKVQDKLIKQGMEIVKKLLKEKRNERGDWL